jgi:hypothetical protein
VGLNPLRRAPAAMAPGSDHGGLTAAASRYLPNPPRTISVPLAMGAWVNANAFGVLAFRPELVEAAMNKQGDIPMNNEHPTDPIGTIEWTERTGGVLTARECVSLAGPLMRDELRMFGGLLALALRLHSGRRSVVDPASLVPPDSSLARGAEEAAQDLLSPALLNHSRRAYAWGAAIAALHHIKFDRELLYMAAMFHDTGLPSPVPHVDFTVRSAALAREFTDRHGVSADDRELIANAIALHHTPGVNLESGAEAYLLSAGAGVDVFGLRSYELPDTIRRSVVRNYPRLGFKREFARLWRAEAKQVPRGRGWFLHRFAMSDLSIRLAPFRG